eukprot:scaffold23297_cov132-Cylindrotheca_fusiformis.AAC.5
MFGACIRPENQQQHIGQFLLNADGQSSVIRGGLVFEGLSRWISAFLSHRLKSFMAAPLQSSPVVLLSSVKATGCP